ncbi:hypothetical protein AtNW77_MTg0322571 (mitochondrion) [Arabidopsis thaliana]|uniref:Uncharacterized protein n=3 Tax=Arabidopsis TaxID=3701 RepID=A0A654GF62_ARATH|nr:uncharacterized protein AT2G07774 [Arabidopsis thaliana]KAG7527954.1 hypothetical protein ISN44_Un239g000020 [Arabidopsis suecica]AEC06077.1 hypothetical protein AT2G07774 [Arabidopsis thaliana]KAG7531452.1 hypothetical protein ISN44_Un34g000100 [Arabidopsis suecica]KAG7531873.1 hypothetical protein ISN44_Un15g000070 [Arabidopsis suecica]CAA0413912.1 unnamed protein product [Arabidopsis thaliana]|eukprot:NP_671806.1 hypothetical protein AT2G07774 [Arabidopsis thaliana]
MENELNLSPTSVQLALLCLIDLPSHSRRAISPFKKNCTRAYGSSIRINQSFRVVIKQAIEVRVRKEKEALALKKKGKGSNKKLPFIKANSNGLRPDLHSMGRRQCIFLDDERLSRS